LRHGEFVYFATYALAGLVLPFSSFFFTLLETYGLCSVTLVAVFMHLCDMYVGVWPSVCPFRLYHVLCSIGRDVGPIDSYYF
jgi:hypothetical protein